MDRNNKPKSEKKSFWEKMPSGRLIVEASLWSADPTHFAEEIQRMDPWVDMYHIDVADGHFVPGFLLYADLVAALRPLTSRPFHVHLMTDNPLNHISDFAAAGADLISVHAENGPLAPAALDAIRRAGLMAGLVLGLDVPTESVLPLLELVNIVVLMGTPMGIKGVKPSAYIYERVRKMKEQVSLGGLGHQVKVFADGGIRENTVPGLRSAGADGVIAGSLIFKSKNLTETINWLQGF